jgi:hypothetical protein
MASDIARLGDQSDISCVLHPTLELVLKSPLEVFANRPHFVCYSQLPAETYWAY